MRVGDLGQQVQGTNSRACARAQTSAQSSLFREQPPCLSQALPTGGVFLSPLLTDALCVALRLLYPFLTSGNIASLLLPLRARRPALGVGRAQTGAACVLGRVGMRMTGSPD